MAEQLVAKRPGDRHAVGMLAQLQMDMGQPRRALAVLVRFIIEFFREPDDHLGFVLLSFSMGQVLCAFMIAAGGFLYLYLRRKELQS